MRLIVPSLALTVALLVVSCDSGPHVVATSGVAMAFTTANLTTGATGSQIRIPNPLELPETIRAGKDLTVSIDASKASYPVIRESDGTLTVSFGTTPLKVDTDGNITVLFVVDRSLSQIVTLRTGPSIKLAAPAIITEPAPASVLKGFSVRLKANVPAAEVAKYGYTWYYSALPASGAWSPISGNAAQVDWTPTTTGNYFIRVDINDLATQKNSSYTSSSSLVFVSEGKDIITTSPFPANVDRGRSVQLSVAVVKPDLLYTWSYSANAASGVWIPVIVGNGENPRAASVSWLPPAEGNYSIKVDITDSAARTTSTFTSTQALVFVAEQTPLITTEPSPARIVPTTGVNLKTRLVPQLGDIFGWSFSTSQAGPWTSIGGSTTPEISWTTTKPVGTYYIKVDQTNAASGATNSFVSKTALVFVEQTANSGGSFGR